MATQGRINSDGTYNWVASDGTEFSTQIGAEAYERRMGNTGTQQTGNTNAGTTSNAGSTGTTTNTGNTNTGSTGGSNTQTTTGSGSPYPNTTGNNAGRVAPSSSVPGVTFSRWNSDNAPVYQTSDGNEYNTMAGAEAHQRQINASSGGTGTTGGQQQRYYAWDGKWFLTPEEVTRYESNVPNPNTQTGGTTTTTTTTTTQKEWEKYGISESEYRQLQQYTRDELSAGAGLDNNGIWSRFGVTKDVYDKYMGGATATQPEQPTQTGTQLTDSGKALLDRVLSLPDQTNLKQYDWWNSSSDKQAVWAYLSDFTNNAQKMADYVMSKGLTNLQQYSWWNTSPVKQQAWNLIQQAQASNKPTPTFPTDTTGTTETTTTETPTFELPKEYIDIQNELKNQMDMQTKYIEDIKKITQDYSKSIGDVDAQIQKRQNELADEIGEARDNIWLSASSLDRRINSAKARAAADIEPLVNKRNSLIAQQEADMKTAETTYNMKKEASDLYIKNLEEMYKAKQEMMANYEKKQESIRSKAEGTIEMMLKNFGSEALSLPGMSQLMANAGYSTLDLSSLSTILSKKERETMLKNANTPFERYLLAKEEGDTATVRAIENWLTLNKTTNTNTNSYTNSTTTTLNNDPAETVSKRAPKAVMGTDGCVLFTRWKMSGEANNGWQDGSVMPTGLFTLQDKLNIINSSIPVVGGAAISGNPKLPNSTGHMMFVTAINGDGTIQIQENMNGVIQDRKVFMKDILGYYAPKTIKNKVDNTFPAIDKDFDGQYAKYKAGALTLQQLYGYFTDGLKAGSPEKQNVIKYIDSKFNQTEIKWEKLPFQDQISWLKSMSGIDITNIKIPTISDPYSYNTKSKTKPITVADLKILKVLDPNFNKTNYDELTDEELAAIL